MKEWLASPDSNVDSRTSRTATRAVTTGFRLTIIHPCVGRRVGMRDYIRTWQMEPLPAATLAALAPRDVDLRFYDDRLESIPFDEPTDLVAISVETYTAVRSYEIASEYRRRGVPVVMGGYHATLAPDEVGIYCESLIIGDAESVFAQLVEDYRHGTPQQIYRGSADISLSVRPDRSIYGQKKYLDIHLIEFARGCKFKCEFCAVTSFHDASHRPRDLDLVLGEVAAVRDSGKLIFFIDDNMTCNPHAAKEFIRALIPMNVRWVSQTAIHVAHDAELLSLMKESGCQGVLVGLESLNPKTLATMNKGFNLMRGGPAQALQNFRAAGLRVYGTFVFGYDEDSATTIDETVRFARDQALFIAAFNHITPFPGTPLFRRMESEGRLFSEAWWRDPSYRYNDIPFQPKNMEPQELADLCVKARRDFYSWPSILQRSAHRVNYRDARMLFNFYLINYMHQRDVSGRNGLPLGDRNWSGTLLPARIDTALLSHAQSGA